LNAAVIKLKKTHTHKERDNNLC